jgi:hypothetical protein
MKRFGLMLSGVAVLAVVSVAEAGATITAPNVDVSPLAQGILDALSSNLATILTGAGILAGVFFVLRMARRWFGARASA